MKALVVATALLISASAFAQSSGFYAGGAIGQATVKDFCEGISGTGISCDDKSTAIKVFGGYSVNANFAAEIGYTDFGKVDVSLGSRTADAKASAVEALAVGSYGITQKLSLYGKAGLYRAAVKGGSNFGFSAESTNNDLTFGAGVLFSFTPSIAARAEWQRYQDVGGGDVGKSDIDVISLGVLYRF